jgi:uncharacterized protein YceK
MILQSFGRRRARMRSVKLQWKRGVAVLLVGLAGCASVGSLTKDSPPEAKQAAVAERAKARWAAMIDGNLDLAYTFLSPASKGIVSLAAFKQQARTGYREAKVEKVECEGAVCKVRMFVTYDHRLMKGMASPLEERWVIDEGQAWLVW